jgi:hypothetical protein
MSFRRCDIRLCDDLNVWTEPTCFNSIAVFGHQSRARKAVLYDCSLSDLQLMALTNFGDCVLLGVVASTAVGSFGAGTEQQCSYKGAHDKFR